MLCKGLYLPLTSTEQESQNSVEVRQSSSTWDFYSAEERGALQDESSAISCTVTHWLYQREPGPAAMLWGGTECSSLPKEMQL